MLLLFSISLASLHAVTLCSTISTKENTVASFCLVRRGKRRRRRVHSRLFSSESVNCLDKCISNVELVGSLLNKAVKRSSVQGLSVGFIFDWLISDSH